MHDDSLSVHVPNEYVLCVNACMFDVNVPVKRHNNITRLAILDSAKQCTVAPSAA
jgi:hypothetical protein